MPLLRACINGLVLLLALVLATPARGGELQVDLLGWRLLQYDRAVEGLLGKPMHIAQRGDGWTDRAYWIDKQAYLVVATHKDRPQYIQGLQVTGRSAEVELFAGLRLGQSLASVHERLGAANRVTTLRLDFEPTRLSVHHYDARNYSLEFDPDGRLYSVRIHTVDAMLGHARVDASAAGDPWSLLTAAAMTGDFARLEPMLRPDVEVYRGQQLIAIEQRYGDFVASPGPALLSAFFDRASGVAAATPMPAPELYWRVTEEMGAGLVYKFPPDSVLREVVFFPYLGSWRVYEVHFRDKGAPAGPVERG
jgi:hypothetical protein